ncbi:MAG: hypothetical protein ACRC7G_16330, partial [Beijerinckiaceae bacterium]
MERAVHAADTMEARLAAAVPASGNRARVYFGRLDEGVFEQLDTPHSYSAAMAQINAMFIANEGARGRAAGSRIAVMKVRGTRG